jgi:hypothetical protein
MSVNAENLEESKELMEGIQAATGNMPWNQLESFLLYSLLEIIHMSQDDDLRTPRAHRSSQRNTVGPKSPVVIDHK